MTTEQQVLLYHDIHKHLGKMNFGWNKENIEADDWNKTNEILWKQFKKQNKGRLKDKYSYNIHTLWDLLQNTPYTYIYPYILYTSIYIYYILYTIYSSIYIYTSIYILY